MMTTPALVMLGVVLYSFVMETTAQQIVLAGLKPLVSDFEKFINLSEEYVIPLINKGADFNYKINKITLFEFALSKNIDLSSFLSD